MGDESQLRCAFENLLDNALKFTESGGEIRFSLNPDDDSIRICVEDTGIGIPEDELPNLFQRFHRARNAYGYPGSGLGLVIVKTIIEGHGGSVQVKNRERGTRFTCHLPAA
jgi:signal transduction histidine kinase